MTTRETLTAEQLEEWAAMMEADNWVDPTAMLRQAARDRRTIEGMQAALRAARQFLEPEVQRGPAVNGWENTVNMVDDALEAADATGEQEAQR